MTLTNCFAAMLAVLAIAPLQMNAAAPVRVQWEGLSVAVGRIVRIAMPDGLVITGKATGVEPEALLMNVAKTTNPKAYPKGPVRVPRADLHRLQMRTKGRAFRIFGTVIGSAAGLILGAGAAMTIHGEGGQGAALFGFWAGGTVAGYFAGDAMDKRWTAIEIVQ